MKKYYRVVFLLVVFGLSFSLCSFAQTQEQRLTRSVSYDPHPATVRFAEKVPFNSEMLDCEIVLHETWKEEKETATISQIRFSLQLLRHDTVVASASSLPFKLGKIKTPQKIATATIGELIFSATLDQIERHKAGITDITLSFSIIYPEAAKKEAMASIASAKTSVSTDLARKIAEKVSSLPADATKARINLLKKALMALPARNSSPDAEKLHNELTSQLETLAASTPKKAVPADKTTEASPPKTAEASDKETKTLKIVDKRAEDLFLQARTLFAQDKGPEGRDALRKALEIAPDYRDALLLLGENALENRKYSRAKEAFLQILQQDSRDAATLLKYFKASYYLGEGAEAINRLRQAKIDHAGDRSISIALAEAFFQLGDLSAASSECNEILTASPDNYQARDLLQRINRLMK
jgi:tetratricopeptide (TPR) repeat protein